MSEITNRIMLKQIIESLHLNIKETEFKINKMKKQLIIFQIMHELSDKELNELIKGIQSWSK